VVPRTSAGGLGTLTRAVAAGRAHSERCDDHDAPPGMTGGGQSNPGSPTGGVVAEARAVQITRATNIPTEEEITTMTTPSAATNPVLSADDGNKAMPGRNRRPRRAFLAAPAARGPRRRHHTSTFRPDNRPRRAASSDTAPASSAAGDPTVARKPMPLKDALAQTRHYIDSSTGPDRAQDIVRLRAQVAQAADLVENLTKVHYQLRRARTAAGETMDTCAGIGSSVRHEQDRLQRAENALRDAIAAQQSRQAWLDEHPETVAHLDELSARSRRGTAVSTARRTPRR
jgi:hypothetical protein